MKDTVWRQGATLVVAAIWLGLPPFSVADEKHLPSPPAAPAVGDPQPASGPKRQAAFPARPGTQITVAPGAHYRATGLHAVLLGHHYRATWATPIPVEVLDLRSYEGGLRPLKKGGGMQTLSLSFEAADGRRYKFRSIDKDPGPILEAKLRRTVAGKVLQDQISASYPGAPLVVDALSAAAGIPYVSHRLAVLPDDDSLGEFRAQFAGQVGFVEARYAVTSAALEAQVVPALRAGDAVMVKGSLGSRMGPIVKALATAVSVARAPEEAPAQG